MKKVTALVLGLGLLVSASLLAGCSDKMSDDKMMKDKKMMKKSM